MLKKVRILCFFPRKRDFKQYYIESSYFQNKLSIGVEAYLHYSFAALIYTFF